MTAPRRLLTVGRSYVVGLNRRLAHEMAVAAAGRWEVTAVAPRFVHGDLRPIRLELVPGEACRLVPVSARLTRKPHVMWYGRGLRAVLRGTPWDVIHVWEEPFTLPGFQVARLCPPAARVVFATFQNLPKRYPPPFAQMERWSLRRSAGWIAFGRTVEQALADRPCYADRPHRVIPAGVDVNVFRPDAAAGRAVRTAIGWATDGPPVVGYLGRFVPEKGLPLLTGALDRLAIPWRALFVGGGPMEAELRAWGAGHGDRVRVVTGVPHDGVPGYLNAMDLLVASSQTTPHWREQLGRMLLEAFACGVAVIGSDSGEVPHVLGNAGRVVAEADHTGWVAALDELVSDADRRADLAARGRERAETVFAWSVVARQHLDFFDDLLAGG